MASNTTRRLGNKRGPPPKKKRSIKTVIIKLEKTKKGKRSRRKKSFSVFDL